MEGGVVVVVVDEEEEEEEEGGKETRIYLVWRSRDEARETLPAKMVGGCV